MKPDVRHGPEHSSAPACGNHDAPALRLPPLRCWSAPRPGLPPPELNWQPLRREGARLWLAKPGQLQVHPSKPGDPCTLWDLLVRRHAWEWVVEGGQVSILTRLDRETSGLVLVALSRGEARRLGRLLQRGELGKEYLALVHGWPAQQNFVVEAPLLARRTVDQSAPIGVEQIVHPDGREAFTRFEVERCFEHEVDGRRQRFALLRVRPETGRMHQIRVHALHAGYPLVGDKIYGQPPSTYLNWIEQGWTGPAARLPLPRQALHCAALELDGTRVSCPLPADLAGFMSAGS